MPVLINIYKLRLNDVRGGLYLLQITSNNIIINIEPYD